MNGRVAVFGGSFNPPHRAHTQVVTQALASGEVDRVIVVPALNHPFAKQLEPFAHRLAMCELAMQGIAGAEVSDIEQRLGGQSLTVRLLEALAVRWPERTWRLVIGSDLVEETHTWHCFARVAELAPPLIILREGHPAPGALGPALPPISSTHIRQRLRTGGDTSSMLAPAVARYIAEHSLYRQPSTAESAQGEHKPTK